MEHNHRLLSSDETTVVVKDCLGVHKSNEEVIANHQAVVGTDIYEGHAQQLPEAPLENFLNIEPPANFNKLSWMETEPFFPNRINNKLPCMVAMVLVQES